MIETWNVIASLRPGAEWSLIGDDIQDIEFITEGVAPITAEEFAIERDRLLASEQEAIAVRAAKRTALLERLGITQDEAALLAAEVAR